MIFVIGGMTHSEIRFQSYKDDVTGDSISPTFYEQLFCTKVLCAASLYFQFIFVLFGASILAKKATRVGEI